MNLVTLNCPSCGGILNLPDNLSVAHCLYCGNKILLDHGRVAEEHQAIERYLELMNVSVEAPNHRDVVQYANKILELDTSNLEAWLRKAESTYLMRMEEDPYNEVMGYMKKASQIAPSDQRVTELNGTLAKLHGFHLRLSGDNFIRDLGRIRNSQLRNKLLVLAMDFYMKALNYLDSVERTKTLELMEGIVNKFPSTKWNQEVVNCLNVFKATRA